MPKRKIKLNPNTKCVGSKAANFATKPQRSDVAMAEALTIVGDKPVAEATQEEIDNAIVLSNNATSIDFMMPEDERQIIEKNLNLYSDMEAMQKVLNIAKKNKKMSEDIKTLDLISKMGEISDLLSETLVDERTRQALIENIQQQIEEGDIMKGYKELATANKIMLDARQELMKSLNSQGNKRSARIALKFENDNGEDFELGVEV